MDDNTSPVLEDVMSGLIQQRLDAPGLYAPRLISNQPGSTMGDVISEELGNSDAFDISVAFVSAETVKTLFEDFRAPTCPDGKRPGRLITSTKNYFNSPSTFWDLLRLKDVAKIDVRVWSQNEEGASSHPDSGQPFHPKGYVFARHMENGQPYYNLYVGSSNLTQQALGIQREWNLKVSSLTSGELVEQFREELDSQIADSRPLTEEWIKQYEEDFKKYAPPRREILKALEGREITPNKMQQEALMNLAMLRKQGEHQAIIISATGTGKTYLSAFDVRQVKPQRMLYLAQQQQILTKAMESYQKVLECASDEMGLFSGTSKDFDRKYVFATVQTMSRPEVLNQFSSDEFDYILIDEVHHAGASSYKRVIDYFKDAGFMLGMTATPERTDGVNIFELFGHNIAYEIRLQKALDENMLCPFHYYGVAEYLGSDDDPDTGTHQINVSQGMSSNDTGQLNYEISQLATTNRVRYIIDKLQQYSPYHQQITGLVFCSSIDEANQLSALFNEQYNQQSERNYRTEAVTGKTSQETRNKAIRRLQLDENDCDEDGNLSLDYIFTVDLFNEGIDIPALNQIVMLRSTQSSIIFTQQLGRGLRKFPHKDSVIVIDFIGNYANNYLIPVALYGNTGDRDLARKNLQRRSIGLSSISFDAIAKERILKSLDQTNWSEMKKLTEQYRQLRFQLGRIPMLRDVYEHDPSLPFTLASKNGNYLDFVRSRERSLGRGLPGDNPTFIDQLEPLTDTENGILKMATELLLPGLRPHELVILDLLCQCPEERIGEHTMSTDVDWRPSAPMSADELHGAIAHRFPDAYLTRSQLDSAMGVLDFSYFIAANHTRFGSTPLIDISDDDQQIQLSRPFADMLASNRTFRIFFMDTLRCGLANCQDLFTQSKARQRTTSHGFLYEQKYTLADVARLLGWPKEMNGQNVGGYFCHRDTGTMPIFVKYDTSQYEDQFLSPQDMRYYSKNGRTPQSPEFQWMRNDYGTAKWQDTHFIPLFVMRREESEEHRYYYVGHVISFGDLTLTSKPDANGHGTVKVTVTNLRLAKPLDTELYRHLTGESTSHSS
jgi:superfamily II DNA or RNA helicase/HKD family nuclease